MDKLTTAGMARSFLARARVAVAAARVSENRASRSRSATKISMLRTKSLEHLLCAQFIVDNARQLDRSVKPEADRLMDEAKKLIAIIDGRAQKIENETAHLDA
jgi:hypothetical protein